MTYRMIDNVSHSPILTEKGAGTIFDSREDAERYREMRGFSSSECEVVKVHVLTESEYSWMSGTLLFQAVMILGLALWILFHTINNNPA